jgi:hypothetical protein
MSSLNFRLLLQYGEVDYSNLLKFNLFLFLIVRYIEQFSFCWSVLAAGSMDCRPRACLWFHLQFNCGHVAEVEVEISMLLQILEWLYSYIVVQYALLLYIKLLVLWAVTPNSLDCRWIPTFWRMQPLSLESICVGREIAWVVDSRNFIA